jgi:transposase-like protein
MLTREQRATMSALWLGRWRGWQDSGVSVAEYARREGFDADAAYRWRRVLRRTGQWIEADGTPARSKTARRAKKRKGAVGFARVAVNDTPLAAASLLLRLVLRNGRRAEIEIGGVAHLGEVLGVLERAA